METQQKPGLAVSILVVEDEKATLGVLCLMLRTKFAGYTVYSAEDGRAGLELVKKHAPDIVITDVNMPIMDGMEMVQEIKTIKADTKFIVLTAYNDRRLVEKCQEIGFSAYIVKPVEFNKLYLAIMDCVGEITRERPSVL